MEEKDLYVTESNTNAVFDYLVDNNKYLTEFFGEKSFISALQENITSEDIKNIDIQGEPSFLFIDKDGNLRIIHVGEKGSFFMTIVFSPKHNFLRFVYLLMSKNAISLESAKVIMDIGGKAIKRFDNMMNERKEKYGMDIK